MTSEIRTARSHNHASIHAFHRAMVEDRSASVEQGELAWLGLDSLTLLGVCHATQMCLYFPLRLI